MTFPHLLYWTSISVSGMGYNARIALCLLPIGVNGGLALAANANRYVALPVWFWQIVDSAHTTELLLFPVLLTLLAISYAKRELAAAFILLFSPLSTLALREALDQNQIDGTYFAFHERKPEFVRFIVANNVQRAEWLFVCDDGWAAFGPYRSVFVYDVQDGPHARAFGDHFFYDSSSRFCPDTEEKIRLKSQSL